MSLASKWLRHWLGFAHGALVASVVAWGFEGKLDVASPLALLAIPAMITTLFSIVITATALVDEQ